MTNKSKHICILGAGVMQLPALRLARELGFRVTVADGNARAPGINLADDFWHIDLKDREALLAAARSASIPLDGVFTAGTDFSAVVAYLAGNLALPGISHASALKASDKSLMRAAFRDHGVPSPSFLCIEGEAIPDSASLERAGLSFPLVVKPVDNMGSRGISRVNSYLECRESIIEAFRYSNLKKVILEEFIEGDEYSIDAIVHESEIRVCGIADRHIFFDPYFVEMGHTIPADISDGLREQIIAVFSAGIRALGLDRGAAKGDIKVNDRGVFIGEIAARLSGGYMSGWTYPYASGRLPVKDALLIAVGLSPGESEQEEAFHCAERAYISVPGVVRSVSGQEKAETLLYVKKHFSRISPGDSVSFPRNNVEKCGNFIAQAATRKEAVSSAEKACRFIDIVLEPDNDSTFGFLSAEINPHACFPVQAAVYEDLSQLPLYTGMVNDDENPIAFQGLSFPSLFDTTVVSWHGESLDAALGYCLTQGIRIGEDGFCVGRPFWTAFINGGRQGARWFRDTFMLHFEKGDWLNWLRSWPRLKG